MEPSERASEIFRLRAEGATLAAIGGRFGISKERVRQILARPPKSAASKMLRAPILTDEAVRSLFLGIENLEVTPRIYNILRREELLRPGDIVTVPLRKLRRIRGLGRASMRELTELAAQHGLRLGLRIAWPPVLRRIGSRWAQTFDFRGSADAIDLLDATKLREILELPRFGGKPKAQTEP